MKSNVTLTDGQVFFNLHLISNFFHPMKILHITVKAGELISKMVTLEKQTLKVKPHLLYVGELHLNLFHPPSWGYGVKFKEKGHSTIIGQMKLL